MVEITVPAKLKRGKHLIDQRGRRQRDTVATCGFQHEPQVFVMEAHAATRRKIVGKHVRSTQLDDAIGGQTSAQYLQNLSRVNTSLRSKYQCLAHGLNRESNDNLIAGFDNLARAILSNMHNRLAQRLKDGQAALKRPFVASHHNGKRTGNRPLIAAAHRSIKHCYPAFSQTFREGSRRNRRNSTHINGNQPRTRSLNHAILAKQNLLNFSSTRQHSDDHIAGRGDIRRSIACRGSGSQKFIRHLLVAILYDQRKTGLEQVMRHRPAHDTQTDETNRVRHCATPSYTRVIAPSEADVTRAAYLANTPLL